MSFLRDGLEIFFHCLGRDVQEAHRFLKGDSGGGVRLTGTLTEPGTRWVVHQTAAPGVFAFECTEIGEVGFLDGRTLGCGCGLAPGVRGQFIGTAWRVVDLPDPGTHVTLQCQGNLGGPGDCPFGFLDGRTGVNDGSVGLAPNTQEPFSGTHWELIVSPVGDEGGGPSAPEPGGRPM